MANYTSTANVVLSVNGKQAQKMLSQLEKDARSLEKQIAKAATAGDKATMKKLQRELNQVNRTMDQLRGSSASTEKVLSRLDKATPKELNKALRQLKNELNGIERGSDAWNSQVAKIKAVKAEIDKVNDSMREGQSLSNRVAGALNKWQTAIFGVIAGITGLVMAGRKAVDAYAQMEQEEANVRKFTGMTADQVGKLNEEFKKMDTRTSREELNQLAQEAGRLGKTSQEDVLGFVRAADKINVALDDLGSGATLTLSKLTGIFGDEKRLGTEKALLSVGSVINELSQNCSASAPYIAEFASRLGGVGSQANMTVQQIMGFAAVLDSNNQELEASATALSQVIVRIYQDPAKYARVAGLDVQNFANLVKTDMNAALIELLGALSRAGNMDALSPMFKDMGETGARAISTLSTLAGHIDEVKSQQQVANEAFSQATSINKEFDVQNNTVQAGLDKAKKRVNELAVELGQKLQPVMKLIISSSTLVLNALSTIVNFFIKFRVEILTAAVAISAYNAAMIIYNYHTKIAENVTKLFHGALKLVSGIVPVLRLVLVAVTNAVQYFTNGLEVNYAMQERWRTAMSAMKFAHWAGLILAVAGAVFTLVSRWKKASEEAERARIEQEKYKKSLTDINQASAEYCAKEISRLKALYKEATNEAASKDERRKAAERLQKLYPEYFGNMTTEQIMVGNARKEYDKLRDSIIEVARARARAAKIEENEKKLLELEEQEKELQKQVDANSKQYQRDKANYDTAESRNSVFNMLNNQNVVGNEDAGQALNKMQKSQKNLAKSQKDLKENRRNQRLLNDAVQELAKGVKADTNYPSSEGINLTYTGGGGSSYSNSAGGNTGGGGTGGGSGEAQDKFAAEKQWKEREEALNRIAYATGEKDYLEYTERMDDIAREFYEKQLQHTDLSESERLKIIADWREAQKKVEEDRSKASVEDENARHNEELATLKQYYLDNMLTKEAYDQKVEEEEMTHARNLLNLIVDGIDKRKEAEDESFKDKADALYKEYENGTISQEEYNARLEELEEEHQKRLNVINEQGARDRQEADERLNQLRLAQRERHHKELEEKEQKLAEMKKDYFGDNPQEKQTKYDADLKLLDVVYQRELAAAGENAAEKLRIDEAYEQAKLALKKKYGLMSEEENRNAMEKAVADSAEWLNGDGGKALTGSLDTVMSGMSAIFSQLSTGIQAELEIQTAAINKRYDAEISRAEGNSYKVKKLEKEKEREIAKAKNEANRKMFAMQVIQAVGQTAQNAISAYGSAAAIPVVGYILAPIAAAMAVEAGMLQVANIKKQQQASEAQGYESGGFTPAGKSDEVAGVVHKGEWVASQKLVNNPRTRPLLEALDYAQRTNTIGSITAADVSRTVTAPAILAAQTAQPPVVVQSAPPTVVVEQNGEYAATMRRLADRLDEPFVTVNTVIGDHGIQKAQEDYDRLMKNKSPKSKR